VSLENCERKKPEPPLLRNGSAAYFIKTGQHGIQRTDAGFAALRIGRSNPSPPYTTFHFQDVPPNISKRAKANKLAKNMPESRRGGFNRAQRYVTVVQKGTYVYLRPQLPKIARRLVLLARGFL
jgi:hypothetical protein